MLANYIDVLSEYYPNVMASVTGSGFEYDQIKWKGGDPLPSKEELEAKGLTFCQEKTWKLIQVERDRRRMNGYKVGDHWYHSDDTSRIQQLGLLMMGANMPANLMWKTLGGEFVVMTPTLAQQIFMNTAISDQTIFTIAEQHKIAMYQVSDPKLYNYMTGWPVTYGE